MIRSCQRLRCYSHMRSAPRSIRPTSPWNNFPTYKSFSPRLEKHLQPLVIWRMRGCISFQTSYLGLQIHSQDSVSSLFSTLEYVAVCLPTGIIPQALNDLPHLMPVLSRTLYSRSSRRRRPPSYRLGISRKKKKKETAKSLSASVSIKGDRCLYTSARSSSSWGGGGGFVVDCGAFGVCAQGGSFPAPPGAARGSPAARSQPPASPNHGPAAAGSREAARIPR